MAGTHTIMPSLCNGGNSGNSGVSRNGLTTCNEMSPLIANASHHLQNGGNPLIANGTVLDCAQLVQAESQILQEDEDDDQPVIDIVINNVVCSFSVACHLDLRSIAMSGHNVEFRRENGMVTMKLRRPLTTASIWSSGKITCTGSTSEPQARIAARRIARCLQKLGYKTRFKNFRVVNVLGTCTMPFAIKITQFSQKFKTDASYEPELHPGVTFKIANPKATLKIFSTGSITVTAPSVYNVQCAIEHIYPLVQEFSKERTPEELEEAKRNNTKFQLPPSFIQNIEEDEEEEEEEEEDEDDFLEEGDD